MYRVTFLVDTDDIDPSTILDAACELAPDLIDRIEGYGGSATADEDDIFVMEVLICDGCGNVR